MNTIPTQQQVTTTYTNPFHVQTDQNDPMDLSATNRGFKKPLTAEQRKYRFENNLCLYCGKFGHRALDHKLIKFTQRINFVSETSTPPPTTGPIRNWKPTSTQPKKNVIFVSSRLQRPSRLFISALALTPASSVEVSDKHLVSRCIIKINGKSENFSTLLDTSATG